MGNKLDREEIRILQLKNLILRDELAHLKRRLDDLELWRSNVIVRERALRERLNVIRSQNHASSEIMLEINRNLERRLEEIRDERDDRDERDERDFSTFIQGVLSHCQICLDESINDYHKCNLCHNTWCLPCHSHLNSCPYCRN